ncbi:MAG TPA: thioredoxin domain-containing protein [Solirubrobacteraceae bacterium]|nr:thioredoxin domain-containing protein [Solirubrobacteraceae bacterium]
MASRTKQKEEARARRLEEERARAERARRDRRLRTVGAIIIGAIIVVGVLIVVSSGGKKGGLQTGTEASATATTVNALLAGIPQSGATLGNPKAPVTMTYFGDYECPICQEFTLQGGFPQLVQNDVRQGKVKVVYKSFCTATCNGPGQTVFNNQQVAGLAAGKQNRFWQYTELFYHEQGQEDTAYANEAYLTGLARQISGLNLSTWQSDRGNSSLAAQVASDESDAHTIGVTGTPTLVFQGPKGQAAASAAVPSYSQLEQAVKQVS